MNKLPRHNGKPIETGHYYGGGGGGGCYSKGFPIHLAGERKHKPRKRGASVAIGLLLLALGFAAGHATAGERWDRVKGFARDHWKPIVGCVAAPALIYKQTRKLEKRMMRDAERRAANHEVKAMEAYAERFPDGEDAEPTHGGYWSRGYPADSKRIFDTKVGFIDGDVDTLYYIYSPNLRKERIDVRSGLLVWYPRDPDPLPAGAEERPGWAGYQAYLGKLDARASHLRRAVDIRGDAFESRKSVQRSALAVATTLCAFTIKR